MINKEIDRKGNKLQKIKIILVEDQYKVVMHKMMKRNKTQEIRIEEWVIEFRQKENILMFLN